MINHQTQIRGKKSLSRGVGISGRAKKLGDGGDTAGVVGAGERNHGRYALNLENLSPFSLHNVSKKGELITNKACRLITCISREKGL